MALRAKILFRSWFSHRRFSLACYIHDFKQVCSENWEVLNPSLDPSSNELLRSQISHLFFMKIIILLCWAIWMSKNDKIFKLIDESIQDCEQLFLRKMDALLLRAKKSYSPRLQDDGTIPRTIIRFQSGDRSDNVCQMPFHEKKSTPFLFSAC